MASKFDDADRLTDDQRTVFMLRAFRHCHDVDWLVCKRLPTFTILARAVGGYRGKRDDSVRCGGLFEIV